VWRCRVCSGQETPSRRRRMSPVLDKLLLCNFWRLGFTALSVCLLCSCPNRYCRPIQTSGCIELVMTWMLPFTCPALCYREIQIFPKNMDSLHFTLKLRPKLWTYKKIIFSRANFTRRSSLSCSQHPHLSSSVDSTFPASTYRSVAKFSKSRVLEGSTLIYGDTRISL